jgi:hypothetical protein
MMITIVCKRRLKMSRIPRIVSNGKVQEFRSLAEFATDTSYSVTKLPRVDRRIFRSSHGKRHGGDDGEILKACGDLDEAIALHKEEKRICRDLGDPEGLAISLTNQAQPGD